MSIEFLGTKGEWYYNNFAGQLVIQDGLFYDDKDLLNTNQPNGVTEEEAIANAELMIRAPKLFQKLKEAKEIIQRLKLSMLAHPDCVEGSEFDDYTTLAQQTEDKIEALLIEATKY